MNTLTGFWQLGFHHIVNPEALDHILFLLALVAGYTVRDWRHLLGVVTAFTIGHSITLASVATGVLRLPTAWVEFLIPITIVLACAANLGRLGVRPRGPWAAVLAATFGLIHGAGFATYLKEMFSDPILVPLFGFNLGIETGQLALLAIGLSGLSLVDVGLRRTRSVSLRTLAASVLAGGWAFAMAVQRWPR